MHKYLKDFVSDEERSFQFRVGKTLASSLSGFVAGTVVASFFWMIIIAAQQ